MFTEVVPAEVSNTTGSTPAAKEILTSSVLMPLLKFTDKSPPAHPSVNVTVFPLTEDVNDLTVL